MSLFPVSLPPGAYRPGSVYQAKGRWYDMSLMRWHESIMQPIGGWSQLIAASDVGSKPVRSMLSWRINTGIARLALGTYQKLYVYDDETSSAATTDITPASGFTAGASDNAKYAWSLDTFGEDLLAVLPRDQFANDGDGQLWQYVALNPSTAMTAVSGAPTGLRGVCVTPERFVFVFGAGGDPRLISWPDQESLTDWTESDTNQAGSFTLQTKGSIVTGRAARRETLIWTDVDLWSAKYIDETLVYGFDKVGDQCGIISPRAVVLQGGKAYWMGLNGFYVYDGFVKKLECDVGDYLFGLQPSSVSPVNAGIDRAKKAWVHAVSNSRYNEITWYYVSQGSGGTGTENDRYVTLNTLDGTFTIGALARTSGVEALSVAAAGRPIMGGTTGAVYQHELAGTQASDWGGSTPYAESGPFELGNGDTLMTLTQWIPDAKSLGQWAVTVYAGNYPTASEGTFGPFTPANPTDIRLTGRQARIKVTAVDGSTTQRFGTPRINALPRGKR